jgi:hypothetical protein
MPMNLDRADLKMALVAVSWYRRAFVLAKRPIPRAADRLADHLHQALTELAETASRGHVLEGAPQEWVSTREAAQQLGCTQRHARRIAARLGHRVGRDWVIPTDALPRGEDNDVDAAG